MLFQNVKRKIIETAESPRREEQKCSHAGRRVFKIQQNRGNKAPEQEKKPFGFDPSWIGQVFHD